MISPGQQRTGWDRNDPADGRDVEPLLPSVDSELLLRWGATAGWIICTGGFMSVLGAEVGAWAMWLAGIVLIGAPMVSLWVRHFAEQGRRAELREGRGFVGGKFDAGKPPGRVQRNPEDEEPGYGAKHGGTSLGVGPTSDQSAAGTGPPPWSLGPPEDSQGSAADEDGS